MFGEGKSIEKPIFALSIISIGTLYARYAMYDVVRVRGRWEWGTRVGVRGCAADKCCRNVETIPFVFHCERSVPIIDWPNRTVQIQKARTSHRQTERTKEHTGTKATPTHTECYIFAERWRKNIYVFSFNPNWKQKPLLKANNKDPPVWKWLDERATAINVKIRVHGRRGPCLDAIDRRYFARDPKTGRWLFY